MSRTPIGVRIGKLEVDKGMLVPSSMIDMQHCTLTSARGLLAITAGLGIAVFAGITAQSLAQQPATNRSPGLGYDDTPVLPNQKWKVHDSSRPRPRMVTPGTASIAAEPPSDAIRLFDGKDLSKWQTSRRGELSEAGWKVENGYMEVAGKGDLVTKEKFGDVQLHVEWATPSVIEGSSQSRGNSGVLLMSRYEIQVLDSWENPTYADGQAGSIYGQWPPLANASRKPGEWQSYDIAFEAPKFEGDKLTKPAYATVFHNGVLLHNRKEISGRMAHRVVGTYAPHGPEEPLGLQNHDTKVRYRNIWIRRITPYDQQP